METTTETVVVQTRKANCEWCKWEDYSRCTPEQAVTFLKARRLTPDGHLYRAVDWITKEPVGLQERHPFAGERA